MSLHLFGLDQSDASSVHESMNVTCRSSFSLTALELLRASAVIMSLTHRGVGTLLLTQNLFMKLFSNLEGPTQGQQRRSALHSHLTH